MVTLKGSIYKVSVLIYFHVCLCNLLSECHILLPILVLCKFECWKPCETALVDHIVLIINYYSKKSINNTLDEFGSPAINILANTAHVNLNNINKELKSQLISQLTRTGKLHLPFRTASSSACHWCGRLASGM